MYKTKIDWCDSSWNPITGCLHGCDYCYARAHVKRFGFHRLSDGGIHDLREPFEADYVERGIKKCPYPFDFDPTFHRYRLGIPASWSEPRTIFVGSMTDLFGDWVPDEWIQEVFAACEAAPQHRYLFLTKNPQRYNELDAKGLLPERDNFWYGGTRTGVDSDREHEAAMTANRFLSVEPILAPMERATLNAIELWGWIIVGAETGRRKNMVAPGKSWIDEIAAACAETGTPIFMKESLRSLMGPDFKQEFPWEVRT